MLCVVALLLLQIWIDSFILSENVAVMLKMLTTGLIIIYFLKMSLKMLPKEEDSSVPSALPETLASTEESLFKASYLVATIFRQHNSCLFA